MIDLIREVRRRAAPEVKTHIRLANPQILTLLSELYQVTEDIVSKTLIKELFSRIGGAWPEKLLSPAKDQSFYLKAYRGQVQLIESSQKDDQVKPQKQKNKAPKKIYRGQVVST